MPGPKSVVSDGTRPSAAAPNDVLWLLDQALASGRPVPALYLACGEDDPLLRDNHAFVAVAEGRVPSLTTDFGPGIHHWTSWIIRSQYGPRLHNGWCR